MKQMTKWFAGLMAVAMANTSCANQPGGNQTPSDGNKYAGKTFSVLGDSYSTFQGAVTPDTNYVWYTPDAYARKSTDVNKVEQVWWNVLADSMQMKLIRNNAFSGATISTSGYNHEDYSDRSYFLRAENLGESADYIFVFGGTNDSWAGAPIGSYMYDEFPTDSLRTFRPAMALTLKKLKELYPQSQTVVIINSELRDSIQASQQAIADHYDIPYVMLYDIAKQDGHPTIAGHRAIAEQVIRVMERLGL